MTIQDLGSIGELVAAIATVATLFYLAMQIRHGAEATRAASQQALLDTFYDAGWELGGDMELARVVGAGLVDFESLNDHDKTRFSLLLFRWIGNLEKGLRLRTTGLIDEGALDSVGGNLVATIRSPGGAQWWKHSQPACPPVVVEYLEHRLADPKDSPTPWEQLWPYWARWARSSGSSSEPTA